MKVDTISETENDIICKKYLGFLDTQLIKFRQEVEILVDKKGKKLTFRTVSMGKNLVKIDIPLDSMLDYTKRELDITLSIEENIVNDQTVVANAAAGAISYLKIFKDLLDAKNKKSGLSVTKDDLEYYESYFKLMRQKWLGKKKS